MVKIVASRKNTPFFKLLFIFFIFINCQQIVGQDDIALLDTPQKFILPSVEVDYKDDYKVLKGSPWIVYSDRQYNKTFTKPRGGNVKYILDFLSPFYVVEKKGDFLKLYSQKFNESDSISKFVDYGWIHMDNLLLWNHSLVSINNINVKAIIVRSEKTENLFTESPSDHVSGFDIFYVYKIQNNSVLLGRQPKFIDNQSGIENCIITWVQVENIWVWDNILTLEPDFCNTSAGSHECYPNELSIYSDKKGARKFKEKMTFQKNQIYTINRSNESWSGSQMRFPILTVNDNIAEIVLFRQLHINKVQETNYFYTGYAPIEIEENKTRLFKEVLLYSSENLAKTTNILSALSPGYNSTSVRTQLYKAWVKILKDEYYGKTENELIMMKIEDVHRYLFFKDLGDYFDSEVTIAQLLDPIIVSEDSIIQYSNKVTDSYETFLNILNHNRSNSSFMSNGILYYWIDSDLLP